MRDQKTYKAGQMLVKINNGTLRRSDGGFDGPNPCVKVKPVSREMKVVTPKSTT